MDSLISGEFTERPETHIIVKKQTRMKFGIKFASTSIHILAVAAHPALHPGAWSLSQLSLGDARVHFCQGLSEYRVHPSTAH